MNISVALESQPYFGYLLCNFNVKFDFTLERKYLN